MTGLAFDHARLHAPHIEAGEGGPRAGGDDGTVLTGDGSEARRDILAADGIDRHAVQRPEVVAGQIASDLDEGPRLHVRLLGLQVLFDHGAEAVLVLLATVGTVGLRVISEGDRSQRLLGFAACLIGIEHTGGSERDPAMTTGTPVLHNPGLQHRAPGAEAQPISEAFQLGVPSDVVVLAGWHLHAGHGLCRQVHGISVLVSVSGGEAAGGM